MSTDPKENIDCRICSTESLISLQLNNDLIEETLTGGLRL